MKFTINGYDYNIKLNEFPAGELGVVIQNKLPLQPNHITIHYDWVKYNDSGIMVIAQLLDALKRHYRTYSYKTTLMLPYVPYSRQDRICNKGESFSLQVFTSFINQMNFDEVITWDNHSDVATALINNCNNIPSKYLIPFNLTKDIILISPDAGALKKTRDIAKQTGKSYIISCDKIRNIKTGQIESIEVINHQYIHGNKEFLVVDDICDGGGTFLGLADAIKAIKPDAKISLYITHGFFTQGIDTLAKKYEQIYTTNSVCNIEHPQLTMLEP